MKIERIDVMPVRLPLKEVATLSRGVSRTLEEGKQVVLVKMTADDGTVGWGEAGPSRRWSAETTHSCYTSIRHYLAPPLIGHDPFDIAAPSTWQRTTSSARSSASTFNPGWGQRGVTG
jgi:muconate cycloisomerase